MPHTSNFQYFPGARVNTKHVTSSLNLWQGEHRGPGAGPRRDRQPAVPAPQLPAGRHHARRGVHRAAVPQRQAPALPEGLAQRPRPLGDSQNGRLNPRAVIIRLINHIYISFKALCRFFSIFLS